MSTGNVKLDLLLHSILDFGGNSTDEAGRLIRARYPSLSEKESGEIAQLLQSAQEQKKEERVTLVATAPASFSLRAMPTKITVENMIRNASASILITGYSLSEYFSDLVDEIVLKSQRRVFVKFFVNDIERQTGLDKILRYKGRFLKVYNYPKQSDDTVLSGAATRCRLTRKSTPPSGGSAGWPNRKRRCWRSWLRRRTPMSKNIQEALLDLKARQEAGEKMPCPRCGRDTMKPDLYTNALSRHADGIYVCDDCGTAEAMLNFMRNPLPLECWAQFREGEATADFKAVPGEEALKTIKAEHVPRLIRIFQQSGADFKALRITAMKECPGLTQIWEEPFQALYTVADGEIVIRFRENKDAVEVAADHLTKAK